MQVIKFDYHPDVSLKKNSSTVNQIIDRPKIPIRLSFNHKQSITPVLCLLDSGADNNLFPTSMGEAIGINMTKYPKYGTRGIGNSPPIETYRVPNVKLLVGYNLKPDYVIIADIDFAYCHNLPLLGRDGFFKFFKNISFIENSSIELHI